MPGLVNGIEPRHQQPFPFFCLLAQLVCFTPLVLTHRIHTYSSVSPRMGFPSLNLAAPMAEYAYGSSYTTDFPGRPYTPPHRATAYPTALMSLCAGEGSGSHTDLSSSPRPVRYNPISVSFVSRSGRERNRRSSKHDDSSNDDDGFAPSSAPTASNEV